jgi:hypothetical protein
MRSVLGKLLKRKAIALDPSHAEAHYKRGNALKALGQLDAGIFGAGPHAHDAAVSAHVWESRN